MKKLINIVVMAFAAMIMVLGKPGYPQENQTIPQEKGPELKWIYGSVAKVSFTAGYIVVFSDQGYTNFKVTDKTAISIGPKKVGLDDINTEDSVRVQYYSPEPGKCVAVSISESKKEENE
jgi:hypothetical protein